MAHVAKRFDLLSRDNKLTWSHYRMVSVLEDDKAQDVLQRATEQHLSVSETRELVKSKGKHSFTAYDRIAALEEIVRLMRNDCPDSVEKVIAAYEETFGWQT